MTRLVKNFINYVKIDTQSDPQSNTVPSTMKQKDLSKLLVSQLKEMGYDAYLDDLGYTYALIPKNVTHHVTPIGFVAHVDTSFDAPGHPVNPRIIKNYQGETIHLNDTLSMHPNEFESLKEVIGDDIIVTDGNTLLGADNKAGVVEIMELAYILSEDDSYKHGDIYICFTPDEEIGRGANYFNHDFFEAEFAYTVDGGRVGGIDYENFNAATANLEFTGISIHPGDAYNKMINASHLMMEFHHLLPSKMTPRETKDYEGFNHLTNMGGTVEESHSSYIIRNHDEKLFNKQKEDFINITNSMNEKYGYKAVKLEILDSYFNMKKIVLKHPHIIELAKKATIKAGLKPFSTPIRGGTDGARLTYDGLPCPNLGTGGYNFHGRFEFASINQMEKSVEILLNIATLNAIK